MKPKEMNSCVGEFEVYKRMTNLDETAEEVGARERLRRMLLY
jgi:hypothetical protein